MATKEEAARQSVKFTRIHAMTYSSSTLITVRKPKEGSDPKHSLPRGCIFTYQQDPQTPSQWSVSKTTLHVKNIGTDFLKYFIYF